LDAKTEEKMSVWQKEGGRGGWVEGKDGREMERERRGLDVNRDWEIHTHSIPYLKRKGCVVDDNLFGKV
jgi:hypothetical protein